MERLEKSLNQLSGLFYERLGVPLFAEIPLEEMSFLKSIVHNRDSMAARLNDLANVLDRINKKDIDSKVGIQSAGSRNCLFSAIKFIMIGEHDGINHIEEKFGFIFLVRGYFTHNRNKSVRKAWEYFQVDPGSIDYASLWRSIETLFIDSLESLCHLLSANSGGVTQAGLSEETRETLLSLFIEKYKAELNDRITKKYLLYLLSKDGVRDDVMASDFNIDLFQLREQLLCLLPDILFIQYYDYSATSIRINPDLIQPLKDYYNGA